MILQDNNLQGDRQQHRGRTAGFPVAPHGSRCAGFPSWRKTMGRIAMTSCTPRIPVCGFPLAPGSSDKLASANVSLDQSLHKCGLLLTIRLHPRRNCVEPAFANKPATKRVVPPLTSHASGVGWKPLLGGTSAFWTLATLLCISENNDILRAVDVLRNHCYPLSIWRDNSPAFQQDRPCYRLVLFRPDTFCTHHS